jgi:FkbM family methyltransferase
MSDVQATSLYDQDTEVELASAILDRLPNRIVIDVGAERGAFTKVFLDHGARSVFAIEPHPDNAKYLRDRFGDEASVTVLELALGAEDKIVPLYLVEDKSGQHPDAFHTLVPIDETPMLKRKGKVTVRCRTLDALVAENIVPEQVGVLKIDTERSDLDVIRGSSRLIGEIVMLEFWDEVLETVGPSSYRLSDVAELLCGRGYGNFAVIKRYDEFETIQLNSAETRAGEWGNAIFVHDSVWGIVAPVVYGAMAKAQTRLVDAAAMFARESRNRITVIEEQTRRAEGLKDELGKMMRRTDGLEQDLARRSEELEQQLEQQAGVIEELQQQIPPPRPEPVPPEPMEAAEWAERQALFAWGDPDLVLVTRSAVLEEQERAIETYLDMRREEGPWQWIRPKLGVLRQHEPVALQIPPYYRRVAELASPPRISIVTPSLNHGGFLERTLRSVLDQGYEPLEYIVQDGGSTDQTLEILGQFEPRLAHVDSEADSGIGQALNRGFAHATGEILAYLNSDDVLLPGSLQSVAAFFAAHPDVDVVYGHRVLLDAHDWEIGRWVLPPHDDGVMRWVDYIPQETLFWRRRVWDLVGRNIDDSFKFAVDWDLLLRLRAAGATFARLPRFLGAFRVHDAQKTSAQIEDVGANEMRRLRLRSMMRHVTNEEVDRAVQRYLRRHVVYHKLYRLGLLRY